jgi:hypothetical protein
VSDLIALLLLQLEDVCCMTFRFRVRVRVRVGFRVSVKSIPDRKQLGPLGLVQIL